MPSILDRDAPRPLVIPANETPSWVIIVLSIVHILLFWIWIIWIIRSNPVSGPIIVQCTPGQCATDILTGIKDCPTDPVDIKTIDPATQVCNSPFTCESSQTPFALLSDGSTNNDGQCQAGVQCRCLTRPQCAYYITSYFNTQNGNPFQAIKPQRIVFQQTSANVDADGRFNSLPPYNLALPTTQFCTIPKVWLNRTWPSVLDGNDQLSNCISGVIAFVPPDPDSFEPADEPITPLSCVQGVVCEDGIPVWNNKTYQLDCKVFDS